MNETSPGGGGERRFAVLLNDNAKKVDAEVRAELARLVPPQDLFFSKTMEEAQEITELLVEREYPVVFTGGGDGTVIDFIDRITRVAEAHPEFECPALGILRLGTGNALAEMVSSGSFSSDIRAYIDNGFQDLQRLALIEAEGRRFPFAGVGWDAEILNDYIAVREGLGRKPVIGPVFQNLGAYFGAFFLRTAPRVIGRSVRRTKQTARIVNTGERGYRLGAHGVIRRELAPGEVLFEGPIGIGMVGTSPYYGYGMKVMPFAGLTTQFMHLRIGEPKLHKPVLNLPDVWKGEWFDEMMHEYYVQSAHMEFTEPMPFQIGGDGTGWRDEVDFVLSDASVQLVRFI